ncbi:uncharacterized aarF domain-containing protein kinase 5-like [Armigeres subalbatus]|uniref:uncharacterized aarF domain-containing protein kinase 5-like n=1 Tax=Armigeres subalbatus TaxID=124917 RepID=UPI002ED03226
MLSVRLATSCLRRGFTSRTAPATRQKWKPLNIVLGATGGLVLGAVGYDGAVNEFETVESANRFLRSLVIGVSISVDYAWSMWGLDEQDPNYEGIMSQTHQRAADRILNGCLANGGLYIKMGQGISSMNHIIPKEYISTLKKLQDKCLTRKPGEVRKLFEQDFGKPPEEVFETFDYVPIAAASLAQVFRGTTKEGQQVAIKVQYADLRKRFNADLRTIMFLQDLAAVMHKNYNFGWILRDLQGTLREELDFIHEGRNSERCAEDLRKHDSIYVPKVLWNYTNERVLTTEFIDGCKINDTEKLKQLNINVAKLDVALFRAFADQIFRTGFVHADPHPGNVFVRKDPLSGRAQLVLLDHGLYGNLTADIRLNLCRFWKAIVLKDYKEMAQFARALNVQDYRTFAEILLQRPLELKGSTLKTRLSDEDIKYMTRQAREHFDKVMQTLRSMPRNLIFVIRNLNMIRAIAREHGDPVDRPKVMARGALAALRNKSEGVGSFFFSIFRTINFEYQLWKSSFQFWIANSYLKLLIRLGRSPDTSHLLDVQLDV